MPRSLSPTEMRASILSIPDWTDLTGPEAVQKLGRGKEIGFFLFNDPELIEARKAHNLRRKTAIREQVVRIPDWENMPLRHLADELKVSQVFLVRALAGVKRRRQRFRLRRRSNRGGKAQASPISRITPSSTVSPLAACSPA